jgi:histidinol-phosphate/aromatic aminotransferase/cobyric acid decarboxylase-like protein/SAM-dependent methyltransferase
MTQVARDWYRTFFADGFWAVADVEYSPKRTDAEVAYLEVVLRELAPGSRLADLGCGKGRHAVALAERGFDVTAIDVAEELLGDAPRVTWIAHDLLSARPWPLGRVDAAILVQSVGWGSDADQRRLLARVRRHLEPGGLLVLDVSNAAAIILNLAPHAEAELESGTVALDRSFDVRTGRSVGSITLGGHRREHSIRLYHYDQVEALLRESGFELIRADADFEPGAEVGLDTRYMQFLARPAPLPPESLAVRFYAQPPPAGALDLRWSPDEDEFLDPQPRELWSRYVRRAGFEAAADYGLDDPYGEARARTALRLHHGVAFPQGAVTFGAGVTMLLRELAQLAAGGDVLVERHAHPDLPAWARARGSRVEVVDGDLARRVDETGPALVVLDRPTITGRVIGLDDLQRLAAAAEDSGTVVIVDESYATYFGPAASAAPLTLETSNLLVLRSVSKGYCTGGLRVGYAVASAPLAPAVREVVCPLAVSSLALGFALELLAAGDVFAPLRARLAVTKPATVEALARLGLDADPAHPALPWVIVPAAAEEVLARRGIAARRVDGLLRMAVPLSDARLAALRQLS